MKTSVKILICVLVAVLVISAAAFVVVGYWLPYKNAQTNFVATRPLILEQQDNGSVRIEWPKSENSDHYLFEISLPLKEGEEHPQVEFSRYLTNNFVTIEKLSGVRTITVYTVGEYLWPFSDKPHFRISEQTITVTDDFTPPTVESVSWITDEVADTAQVELSLNKNSIGRLYRVTDVLQPKYERDLQNGKLTLQFGDGKDYPMPKHGETFEFIFDAYRQTEDYSYYGRFSESVKLVRDDLLGTDLALTCTEEANDSVTFTWNETKGDYYLFQYRKSSRYNWKTLLQIPADGELSYHIDGLDPYSYQEYRVIARHDDDDPEAEPVAQTEAISVQTESVLQYCSIWAIQEQEIYADAEKTLSLGKVKAGAPFCVLDKVGDMFQVRYNNDYAYIDSNYCLINVAEFFGTLCKYDITNSYSSIYKFHTLNIPEVTETIIVGYEEVQLSETEYLVPLLYPTAVKFEKAAQKAVADGYYFKIYDSFRPQAATKMLYDVATEYCKVEISEEDFALLATLPEADRPVIPEGEPYTYQQLVTDNGRFTLNYFLAKGVSMHNRGLAIDMTLEKNGEDLLMQSQMHDLTWYSEVKRNNPDANRLAKYMKEAGFAGLVSEWWHFQDNDTRDTIAPKPLWNGVTREGWKADENGWRYRRSNGNYYKNCTRTIGGVEYVFDKAGYVIGNPFGEE